MTKKHFIALADKIVEHNRIAEKTGSWIPFDSDQLATLTEFCRSQNLNFNRERWLDYIAGK